MNEQQEHSERLLVVDDDDAFRSLVTIALTDAGFEVDEANDGRQALEIAKKQSYGLILLDIKMPDIDGLEALKLLKEITPSSDFMMITGYHDIKIAVEAIKLGAKEYLTKPVDADDLVLRIRSALRAHKAEARLKDLQADFMSRLLYEIRTPLGTVKSVVSFLLRGMAGPLSDQQHEALNHLDMTTGKMVALMSDMIDLTKFELGRVNIEKKQTNLQEFIPKICTRLEPQAKAKKLSLSVNVAQNAPAIGLDPEKIDQVLTNLIDNAIKYSNEGGTIAVNASPAKMEADGKQKDCIEISVKDSGGGISPEDLPFVFDKYKEFLTGKKSEKKTTGLGLAICRSIVEAHKGKMTVESEVGKGSTFKVMLPINEA